MSPTSKPTIPQFGGEILTTADTRYEQARELWNAMIDTRPTLIAMCRNPDDVMAALNHARNEGLEVAVRGGGHSVAGHSSSDGGLVIDLRHLNGVSIDAEQRRAHVRGGALLADLDREAHKHSLATTGGMVHHTGVAGLTLGGGYGWLGRLHGLSCDNLISAEVVTADGQVVTASADHNPDLYWGLRGAGGNFGIVTGFEFALHPIGPVLSEQIRYPAASTVTALHRYREFMTEAPDGLCSLVGVESGRGTGVAETDSRSNHELYIWYTYAGDDPEQGRRLGRPLRAVEGAEVTSSDVPTYPALQSITGDASGPGKRHYWKGSLLWDLSDEFLEAFAERGSKTKAGAGIEMFSLGGAIARVDENATAYSNRDASFDLLPAATWTSPDDDEEMVSLTRESWTVLSQFGRAGVYVNDLGTDAADRVREVYGPAKFQQLVELKGKWDPDNVFHLNANIPTNLDRRKDQS